jgi:hypothetical protein
VVAGNEQLSYMRGPETEQKQVNSEALRSILDPENDCNSKVGCTR